MAEENSLKPGYHYIGLGLVAENKAIGSKIVLYKPAEDNPLSPGDLVSENKRLESKFKDSKGIEQTAVININSARPAVWLADDTFRITAPDVRRGEKIKLYQYADKDEIYWKEFGDGKSKRRGETIVIGASARINMGDSTKDENESMVEEHYRMEFSGHKRIINIATSKANKEVSVYTLLFDGGNGQISLGDAEGNEFTLDTVKKRWALRNNEGSYIVLDKKNIMIGCEESLFMQSEKQIALKTNKFFLQAVEIFIEAKTIKSKATTWDHEGNFNLLGDWSFTGTGKATGGLSVSENITTQADVRAGNISLIGHLHRAQGESANTTKPIAG